MNRGSIVPESACPSCNKVMDRATSISEDYAVPTPGSLSICICCGELLEYSSSLHLQMLSKETLEEVKIKAPKIYRQLIKAQRMVRRRNKEGDYPGGSAGGNVK